jgi:hypothetical protein
LAESLEGGAVTGARKPLPFEPREQYDQFMREFGEVIDGLRVNGKPISAQGQVIGTSATFYSRNPDKPLGHHFDRGRATGDMSDVDIDIHSPEMVRHMLTLENPAVNEKVLVEGKRTLFKSDDIKETGARGLYSQFPALGDFAERWSAILGRDVEIKLKMDLTPIRKIKASADGPIEFFRRER